MTESSQPLRIHPFFLKRERADTTAETPAPAPESTTSTPGSSATPKKNVVSTKFSEEDRNFKESWTLDFLVIQRICPESGDRKLWCLSCKWSSKSIRSNGAFRHYHKKHRKYHKVTGQDRLNLIESLMKKWKESSEKLEKAVTLNNKPNRCILAVSKLIAQHNRPFTEGEFIKKCCFEVLSTYAPETVSAFQSVSLSAATISSTISKMDDDCVKQLSDRLKSASYYSLCIDESTDITKQSQVIIFIRYIDKYFETHEELAGVHAISEHCTGDAIYQCIQLALQKLSLNWERLVSISTDGASYMLGNVTGLAGLVSARHPSQRVLFCHCLIHQQALCAKTLLSKKYPLKAVLDDFSAVVKFMRKSELRTRLFKKFSSKKFKKPLKLLYHNDIRWLSAGESSSRFLDLYEIIRDFLPTLKNLPKKIGKIYVRLKTKRWKFILSFFADLTSGLNLLNKRLQGNDKCMVDLYFELKSAKEDLIFLKSQVSSAKFTNLPRTNSMIKKGYQPAKELVGKLSDAVNSLVAAHETRFSTLTEFSNVFEILSDPFSENHRFDDDILDRELLILRSDSIYKTIRAPHSKREIALLFVA